MTTARPERSAGAVAVACAAALAATPARLLRPRPPDRALLAGPTCADPPPASATVRLRALVQAEQRAPTAVVAEGAWRPPRLRLGMTSFLVEHPRARFLVDPALCRDVHTRVLPAIPMPLRPVVAPDRPVLGLPDVLGRVGVRPEDVDLVLPTHLHWDHVSGLAELPGVAVRTLPVERRHALDGPVAPLGFVREPLAGHEIGAYDLDGPPVLTFARSHDLFGDGAVVLVDLAGHTPGSVGVLLAVDDGRRVLLVGDAVWHGLQVRLLREKAPFPGQLVDHDRDAAFAVVHRLHALPPGVDVVPSHDRDAAERWTPFAS